LILPPLATWLISTAGWRVTYMLLGLVTLLIGPAAALLLEHSPQRRGLLPDGASSSALASASRGESMVAGMQEHQTLGTVLRSRTFWLLYMATFAAALGAFTPFAHLAAYAQDHGLSGGFGALLIALIGVGSTAGRLLLGKGADRFGIRRSLMGMFLGMMVMFLWWFIATNAWTLVIFALFFGVFYGGFVALAPALTAVYFGGSRISTIIGIQLTGVGIGTLIGPGLAGIAYDLSHSYSVPILVSAVVNLLAVCCVLFLGISGRQKPTEQLEGIS
ncbi:MAG TPA: MFS transporter, partial [Ktedonobacteraceae bacterium]|nr:MFS transporter [Ktedonobacteraceae bacterium]